MELTNRLKNKIKHTFHILNANEIDICGAMPEDKSKKFWGDWHYANAMKRELSALGYKVNILTREHWYDDSLAKYVIVLRGKNRYEVPNNPKGRKYIMWGISHPADITVDECNSYDFVFFASKRMQEHFKTGLTVPSDIMMQCADAQRMTAVDGNPKEYELLFVGNSRHVYRQILKDLLPTPYQLSVYGRHWEKFPVQDYVVAKYFPNSKVGQAYHDAKILLNDHWDDMREYGIISNRIFDALHAGAFIISDHLPEIDSVFDGSVITYTDREDLAKKIDYYMQHDKERDTLAKKGQQIVVQQHTFKQRMQVMSDCIRSL